MQDDICQGCLCRILIGCKILSVMHPPHLPKPRLTPHLRPGFLIEWCCELSGARHIGIILKVHYRGISEPQDHYVDVLSPWGSTVFVREITQVLAVMHHSLFLLRK